MENEEVGGRGLEGRGAQGAQVGAPSLESGIVTARGTGDGLVLRMDGRAERDALLMAVVDFVTARRGFLEGHEITLEWLSVVPGEAFVAELSAKLKEQFAIDVKASRLWEGARATFEDGENSGKVRRLSGRVSKETAASEERAPSLFDGFNALRGDEELSVKDDLRYAASTESKPNAWSEKIGEGALWDDPDARIIYSTLRSGQKIETEHSLVVFGDVNSGAEIIAGGDIIVLGALRGVAHAGAYDETGGGRVIFALNLQPTQLRIGLVISRGSAENGRSPEVARVEGNLIVVEPYLSKSGTAKTQARRW